MDWYRLSLLTVHILFNLICSSWRLEGPDDICSQICHKRQFCDIVRVHRRNIPDCSKVSDFYCSLICVPKYQNSNMDFLSVFFLYYMSLFSHRRFWQYKYTLGSCLYSVLCLTVLLELNKMMISSLYVMLVRYEYSWSSRAGHGSCRLTR